MRRPKITLELVVTTFIALAATGLATAFVLFLLSQVGQSSKAQILINHSTYKVECEGYSARYTNNLTECLPHLVIEDYAIKGEWGIPSFFYSEAETLLASKCKVTTR